ncbi:hypothetical protein BGX27_008932, partial [Mortierella sp. AM989]
MKVGGVIKSMNATSPEFPNSISLCYPSKEDIVLTPVRTIYSVGIHLRTKVDYLRDGTEEERIKAFKDTFQSFGMIIHTQFHRPKSLMAMSFAEESAQISLPAHQLVKAAAKVAPNNNMVQTTNEGLSPASRDTAGAVVPGAKENGPSLPPQSAHLKKPVQLSYAMTAGRGVKKVSMKTQWQKTREMVDTSQVCEEQVAPVPMSFTRTISGLVIVLKYPPSVTLDQALKAVTQTYDLVSQVNINVPGQLSLCYNTREEVEAEIDLAPMVGDIKLPTSRACYSAGIRLHIKVDHLNH